MVSFNRVVLAGNLTRDPELRFTNNGVPVTGFGIAVNRVRSKNEEVDFFDVSAWRELGETIANYKKKGDPILIEGRLQFRSWQAQDGTKRNKVDIVADNIQFLSSGSGGESGNGDNGGNAGNGGGQRTAAGASSQNSGSANDPNAEDDPDFDIPF